jgi:hypothetical protein
MGFEPTRNRDEPVSNDWTTSTAAQALDSTILLLW